MNGRRYRLVSGALGTQSASTAMSCFSESMKYSTGARAAPSSRRTLHTGRVLVGAERADRAVGVPVRLQALEDLLPVVQHRGGRVELDRPVRRDARAVPSALLGPADVGHVVGEVVAEPGVGEDRLALGLGLGGLVGGDLPVSPAGDGVLRVRFVVVEVFLLRKRKSVGADGGADARGDRVADLGVERRACAFGDVGGDRVSDPLGGPHDRGGRAAGRPRGSRRSGRRCPSGDVRSGTVHRLEHARESAVGSMLPEARGRCRRARPGREDVAEEVVRDDDVESSRIRDEEDGRGVDVQVIDRDIRELGATASTGASRASRRTRARWSCARASASSSASGCRGERAHDARPRTPC